MVNRLDLIVRDIDRRGLQALVQFLDLSAHSHAQLGVEVGQRLIEQEDFRSRTIARPIATRWRWPPESFARMPFEQGLEVEDARSVVDALRDQGVVGPRNLRLKPMLSRTVMWGYNA